MSKDKDIYDKMADELGIDREDVKHVAERVSAVFNDSEVERVDNPEEAEVIVCARTKDMESSPFADNVFQPCDGGCGFEIMSRPYMPTKAKKMCLKCTLAYVQSGGSN